MRNSRSRLGAVWGISLFAASACGQMKSASEEGAAASAREQAKGSAAARTPTAEEDTVSEGTEKDPSPSPQATAAPSARADIGYGSGDLGLSGIGHGGGAGPAPGFGNGAAPSKMRARGEMGRMGGAPASPPGPSGIVARPAADPVPLTEAVLDPNGRYATTYRPGAGHLAAFESAVALGIVPAAEREVVSDVGARYIPSFDARRPASISSRASPAGAPPTGGRRSRGLLAAVRRPGRDRAAPPPGGGRPRRERLHARQAHPERARRGDGARRQARRQGPVLPRHLLDRGARARPSRGRWSAARQAEEDHRGDQGRGRHQHRWPPSPALCSVRRRGRWTRRRADVFPTAARTTASPIDASSPSSRSAHSRTASRRARSVSAATSMVPS